ncbi:NlpC/P60 family protein [Nonomuraea terrae]|uniref:NlpC/P60 family protein n=1 Tax=Nonomuraea terrae TaxID=2530383 RepID=A0A4R4XUI9_9ACTN|nr:NlpC/P60 family protein [Nonomuraea terrae]TDD34639.1 NlpC/P60 family protein [Nonomuraea terrae]
MTTHPWPVWLKCFIAGGGGFCTGFVAVVATSPASAHETPEAASIHERQTPTQAEKSDTTPPAQDEGVTGAPPLQREHLTGTLLVAEQHLDDAFGENDPTGILLADMNGAAPPFVGQNGDWGAADRKSDVGALLDQGRHTAGTPLGHGERTRETLLDQGQRAAGSLLDQGERTAGTVLDQGRRATGTLLDQGERAAGTVLGQGRRATETLLDEGQRAAGTLLGRKKGAPAKMPAQVNKRRTGGEIALSAALRHLGVSYSWGGGSAKGPTLGIGRGASTRGFDCSGLALYAWSKAGVKLAHYTGTQFRQGRKIPLSARRPGDLLFFGGGTGDPTHVGLFLRGNLMIHAPKTGDVVRTTDFRNSSYYRKIFRGVVRPG